MPFQSTLDDLLNAGADINARTQYLSLFIFLSLSLSLYLLIIVGMETLLYIVALQ